MSGSTLGSDGNNIEDKTGERTHISQSSLCEANGSPSGGDGLKSEASKLSSMPQPLRNGEDLGATYSTRDVGKEAKKRFTKSADEQFGSSQRKENERRKESATRPRPILEADLREIDKTFVVPDCLSQVRTSLAERIVLLTGKYRSGKYTAVCFLAHQLLNDGQATSIYRISDNQVTDLASLIKEYPHSFIIVKDALSKENSIIFRSISEGGVNGLGVGSDHESKAIWQALSTSFSDAELEQLGWEIIGGEYEDLGGEGRAGKARKLITYLQNHKCIPRLIKAVAEARPHLKWGGPFDAILRLQKQLEESSSYLVLTIADDSLKEAWAERMTGLFTEQGVRQCCYQPPDLYTIFKSHLQDTLGKENAETWIDKHGGITDDVYKCHQPMQVVELARSAKLLDDEFPAKAKEIVSAMASYNEIANFFESLDDERKLLALNLSLLGTWPESEFWHTYKQLTPKLLEAVAQVDVKDESKEKQKKPVSQFGIPKSKLLEDIRAHTVSLPTRFRGKEYQAQYIEFIDDRFAQRVQDYIKKNYPDFLERMISHLVQLAVASQDDPYLRFIATSVIGLISGANWYYVHGLIAQWAESDSEEVRAMAGSVLSCAYDDPETRIYATDILQQWTQSESPALLCTAASTYKEVRHIGRNFALNGLERMARHLNLSPLRTIIPLRSALIAGLDEEQLGEFLSMQAGIDLHRTDSERMTAELEAYQKSLEEAGDALAKIEPVFDAVLDAIIEIAFDYLDEIVDLLCDWVNEEHSKDHTIQLTGSLIWLRLASELADKAKEEKTQNRILELISRDEETLDSLAELLSGCLVQLFPIRLANNKRMSFDICLTLEEWAKVEKYFDTIYKLLNKMRHYLSDSPRVLGYFDQLFKARWRSQRMPKSIRSLAQAFLPQ